MANKVAFLHLPKSGGMSVESALIDALQPATLCQGFDGVLFGDFGEFGSLSIEERARIYNDLGALQRDVDLVSGHFARSTLKSVYSSHSLFTIVREPRARLISHWLYWRGTPDSSLANLGSWGERVMLARRPLSEFLSFREVACQTDNLFLRMLLWPHPLIPEGDFISREADLELIEAASLAMEDFAFIGVLEDPKLDERLGRYLGQSVSRPRLNETPPLPNALRPLLSKELADSSVLLLNQRTRLDAVLWGNVARGSFTPSTTQEMADSVWLRTLCRYIESGVTSRLSAT